MHVSAETVLIDNHQRRCKDNFKKKYSFKNAQTIQTSTNSEARGIWKYIGLMTLICSFAEKKLSIYGHHNGRNIQAKDILPKVIKLNISLMLIVKFAPSNWCFGNSCATLMNKNRTIYTY